MASSADGAVGAPLQLALFDDRRSGSERDDPADQLLAYFPAHVSSEDCAGAVGLMRAVLAFATIFTEVWLQVSQHRVSSRRCSYSQLHVQCGQKCIDIVVCSTALGNQCLGVHATGWCGRAGDGCAAAPLGRAHRRAALVPAAGAC